MRDLLTSFLACQTGPGAGQEREEEAEGGAGGAGGPGGGVSRKRRLSSVGSGGQQEHSQARQQTHDRHRPENSKLKYMITAVSVWMPRCCRASC